MLHHDSVTGTHANHVKTDLFHRISEIQEDINKAETIIVSNFESILDIQKPDQGLGLLLMKAKGMYD